MIRKHAKPTNYKLARVPLPLRKGVGGYRLYTALVIVVEVEVDIFGRGG